MPGMQRQTFYQKHGKRLFDFIVSLLGLILLSPLFLIIAFLILFDSGWPIFFFQKRVGKNGKLFTIFKFRTMVKDAKKLKKKYFHLNEVDGPVFKIRNDPRYTKFGKLLAHSGLDELPQLINVLIDQMSLVGPRPLPISEEKEIQENFKKIRRSIRPGITSGWVVFGAHNLKFKQWVEFDKANVKNISFLHDLKIILKTISLIIKPPFEKIKDKVNKKSQIFINFILLHLTYFLGIGSSAIVAKIFNKHFLNMNPKKSSWQKPSKKDDLTTMY